MSLPTLRKVVFHLEVVAWRLAGGPAAAARENPSCDADSWNAEDHCCLDDTDICWDDSSSEEYPAVIRSGALEQNQDGSAGDEPEK